MPGPVLFRQLRIGKSWKPFTIYKFRTMVLKQDGESDDSFDAGDKSRITRFGRILRRTKIDELPQLLNLLKGDISLVGPRPEVQKWTEIYKDKWEIVLSVKPGITDNASLEFINEEDILSRSENPEELYQQVILPRKLDLYVEYVNNHSFLKDLKIVMRTIKLLIYLDHKTDNSVCPDTNLQQRVQVSQRSA